MSRSLLPMPESVDIALTGQCNLRCQHCYYADEMTGRADLPTDAWLSFFEELRDAGIMRVILTGGEIFTRRDIWALLDGVVANKMRFQILTNATLITENVASRLATYRKRLDSIQVSVDGSRPETHDALRGKGAFERTMRGIDALKKLSLPWTVRVTVSKLNVDDLEATLNLLHGDLGLVQFGVNEAYPMGAGHCNHVNLEMTREERRLAFRVMQEFDKNHPGVARGALSGPLIIAEMIERVKSAHAAGEYTDGPADGCLTGCGIMWQRLAVLHDGTYVPCHQLPHLHLGRIGQRPFRDVWLGAPDLVALRKRRTIPLNTDPRCVACRYQSYCTGGCPGVAYAITGNVNLANPRDCYRAYVGEDPEFAF
ncbi:MAG: radical SAM protein [Anaerolineae bacterium]|nr:radical SAM protein [Anaerolineae bacterium]